MPCQVGESWTLYYMRVEANGLGRGADVVRSASAMAGEAQEVARKRALLKGRDDVTMSSSYS